MGGTEPGQEQRPQTHAHTACPSSWHLWGGVCLSRSQSLSLSSSLCTDVSGAAASVRNGVRKGGGEGASPGRWEPQCHAPRLPNSAGGREREGGATADGPRAWALLPHPLPSPPRPREMERAQGWGRLRDTRRGREIERQSDGERERQERSGGGGRGAAQRRETAWNRDRGDAERRWEARDSLTKTDRSETQRETDRGQSRGRETELGKPGKEEWV